MGPLFIENEIKMVKRDWKLLNSSYFTSKSIVQPFCLISMTLLLSGQKLPNLSYFTSKSIVQPFYTVLNRVYLKNGNFEAVKIWQWHWWQALYNPFWLAFTFFMLSNLFYLFNMLSQMFYMKRRIPVRSSLLFNMLSNLDKTGACGSIG